MNKLFARLDQVPPISESERLLIDSLTAVTADKIAPRAADYDKTAQFPWDNIEELNRLGLNAMFVPEAYGGAGQSYVAYLAAMRVLAKACASTAIIWGTNFHAVKPLIDFGSEDQKSRFLPRIAAGGFASLCITEPNAGSDATSMETRFEPDGDEIVINGGKTFITSGDVADLYLLFGKWSEIDDPKAAISLLVLEKGTPGLKVLRLEDKMGMRASSTATIAFEGCRVPRDNLLGEPGHGLRLLFAALNKSRPSIAAHALGIAGAAFEDSVSYINQRRQSNRAVIDFQGIQFMLADLAAELAFCERWLWHVGQMIDDGEDDVGIEASMLKLKASDLAMRAATDAVQLHGGYGYCRDYRVERLMRDAKICQIWEGTNQVHRQLIGRSFIEK